MSNENNSIQQQQKSLDAVQTRKPVWRRPLITRIDMNKDTLNSGPKANLHVNVS
jgi:hypothetical protein